MDKLQLDKIVTEENTTIERVLYLESLIHQFWGPHRKPEFLDHLLISNLNCWYIEELIGMYERNQTENN